MGTLYWLLEINIAFNDDRITLTQTVFIDKILNRFGLQQYHSVTTPIDPNHRLIANIEQAEKATCTE